MNSTPFLGTTDAGLLFFSSDQDNLTHLTFSDGTDAGTAYLWDLPGQPDEFTTLGRSGALWIFQRIGTGLFSTDGTSHPPLALASSGSPYSTGTQGPGGVYFTNDDGQGGEGLWFTDGTVAGTSILRPALAPGANILSAMTTINGAFVFLLVTDAQSASIWRSDGTPEGTEALLPPRSFGGTVPSFRTPASTYAPPGARRMVMNGADDGGESELWVTDGTMNGTRRLQDICAGACSSFPSNFAVAGDLVYFAATDATGRRGLWALRVADLSDVTPPHLECADETVEATAPTGALAHYAVTAEDDVTASPSLVFTPAPGTWLPLGATAITARSADRMGNQSSCTFTATVADTTPPHMVCPNDLSEPQLTSAGTVVKFNLAPATDLVSGALVPSATPASGALFPLGTTKVAVTATDLAGNRGQCSFKVTIYPSNVESAPAPKRACGCGEASGPSALWGLALLALALRPRGATLPPSKPPRAPAP